MGGERLSDQNDDLDGDNRHLDDGNGYSGSYYENYDGGDYGRNGYD